MNIGYDHRPETCTPSSMAQAAEFANLRRAQSPDGRFSIRCLRNSTYDINTSDFDKHFRTGVRIAAWIGTAVLTGVLSTRIWM